MNANLVAVLKVVLISNLPNGINTLARMYLQMNHPFFLKHVVINLISALVDLLKFTQFTDSRKFSNR